MTYTPMTMTGMCRNGAQRDSGRLYHAVVEDGVGWDKALCGARPGKRGNGWSAHHGAAVTCPRCLKKLGDAECIAPTEPTKAERLEDAIDRADHQRAELREGPAMNEAY